MADATTAVATGFTLVDVAIALGTAVALFVIVWLIVGKKNKGKKLTPHVSSWIPWVGSIASFGQNPVDFITKNAAKYGEMFTATILGKEMTFITHPDAYDVFFKAYDDELSLREVYRFMKPVFGAGVVYDASSTDMMMEQLRFVTSGMTTSRFRDFVSVFEDEVNIQTKALGESGECDVFDMLAQLIIFTASRCLLGNEIRQFLQDKNMADLYHELDDGISPLTFFFPNMPQSQRDRATKKVFAVFQQLIDQRRKDPSKKYDDVLDSLINGTYKNGTAVPDSHICGILLAGLFAGQHTSSIASSWTLMHIIADKDLYKRVMQEQKTVLEGKLDAPLSYESLREMELLDRCMKEALRMHPPLIMIMRYVKQAREYKGMTIPVGNVLVVSPSFGGRHPAVFENPDKYDPDRFDEIRKEHEKCPHAYLGFGSGRHKCIGEAFATLQVKAILSCILRKYEMEMTTKLPGVSYKSLVVGPDAPRNMRYKKRTSW